MAANSGLVQILIDTYFPGILDDDLHTCVSHLLSCVHTEHRCFAGGPLRQLLLSASLEPAIPESVPVRYGARGVLRLHLANGLLYELHLHGNIGRAMHRVPTIAEWLASRACDVEQFDHYDVLLSQLVTSDRVRDDTCSVHLARRATLAPPPGVRPQPQLKMAFTTFNLLRQDYGFPPLEAPPKLLADLIVAAVSGARDAAAAYLGGLDQHVLGTVRHFADVHHRRYDDLLVYNFLVSTNPQSSRYRLQAIHALPWLLHPLSGMDKLQSYDAGLVPVGRRINPSAACAIIPTIDAGKPLFEAVATAFDVPKETIRWTRGRMLPYLAQLTGPRTDLLLAMLSWLPPEKRPATEAEWQAMRKLIYALLTTCVPDRDYFSATGMLTAEPRYAAVLAPWVRELTRLSLVNAATRIQRLKQAGNGPDEVNDFLDALRRSLRRFLSEVERPAPGTVECYQRILLEWLATQPFHRVIALSRQWHESMLEHADQQRLRMSYPGHADSVKWPAVLREPLQVHCLTVVELTDSDSLVEEGVEMRHCVGGYSARCALAESLIVSIRAPDGRRLSTAELAIQQRSGRIHVRQHKGKQNGPALARCEEAVADLVKLLNGPAYQEPLTLRRQAGDAQRQHFEASTDRRARDTEEYRRAEEYNAWSGALGQPPAERSLPWRAILRPNKRE